jgi:hypothetical protein
MTLHVAGSIKGTGTNDGLLFLENTNSPAILRVLTTGGQTFIQSGTASTSDSRADINFTSMFNGTNYMKIQGSTGNIGIGTTSPESSLHLSAPIISGENAAVLTLHNTHNLYDRGRAFIKAEHDGIVSAGNKLTFHTRLDTAASYFGTDYIYERMCIKHNGNVGIGTTDPSGEFHINGENMYFSSKLVSNCTWRIMPQTSNATKVFRIYDQDNAADRLAIDASGNVGIGKINPGTKLDVNGGIRTRLPHMWARQTVQPSNTTSLLLVWNNTVYNDTTLGNMYSTTRTCNFPIKGVYVVTVQAHSYYAGGGTYYTDFMWVQKNSGGGTRWTTYNNPRELSQNEGNSDMHLTETMVIVADAGDYLEVTHSTQLQTARNYNGGWNNIRAACIYQIN